MVIRVSTEIHSYASSTFGLSLKRRGEKGKSIGNRKFHINPHTSPSGVTKDENPPQSPFFKGGGKSSPLWQRGVRGDFEGYFHTNGFTFIDSLLVVMIIGILGLAVIPQLHSITSESKLNEAAGELISALQYAGNQAIQYQRPFGLKTDLAGNWFRVFDDKYKADSNPHYTDTPPVAANGVVLNPFDKNWYLRNFDTLSTYEGVKITAIPAGGEIRFYPDGHSGSSDSVFVISFAGSQRTITVNGITGKITVQ